MTRLICRIVGHRTRPVTKVVNIEGTCIYAKPDPDGDRLACRRCRRVLPNPPTKEN